MVATTVEDQDSTMDVRIEDMEYVDQGGGYPDEVSMEDEEAQAEEENLKLVAKETRTVVAWRFIFALVLLATAIGVSIAVFLYSRDNETENFEREFADNGQKIVDNFLLNAKRRVGAINNLATAITSHALASVDRWPYVTVPDFERQVTGTLDQAQIISLTLMPIVTNETRHEWETYSVYKQDWFLESMKVRQEEIMEWSDKVAKDEADILATLEDVGDGLDKAFRINPAIYRVEGLNAGPETTDGPYLPIWQFAPNIPLADLVNFNVLSHPSLARESASCMGHQRPVIGRAFDFANETNPEVAGRKPLINLYLLRWKGGGNHYEAGPVSDLYVPVFDNFSKNKTIVAVMLVNVYWQIYFTGILAENAKTIVAVLENRCHGSPTQSFTYVIRGDEASYLGPNDLHDTKYDYLERSTGFGAFLPGEGRDDIEYNCVYNVRVYPTDDMKQECYTNTPYVFAGALLGVFVFTSLVFLAYDRCVERRQRVLKRTAEQSTSVVASLFPEKVRDRLFDTHLTRGTGMLDSSDTHGTSSTSVPANNAVRRASPAANMPTPPFRRRRSSNSSNPVLDQDDWIVDNSLPIADLYPNCTVFFADIAGFTRWCDGREPTSVFKLLETLYGSFDRIAKRMQVFKIETIGDCYVAVTGLPKPQPLNAVIMSRFAAQCLVEMGQVCSKLTLQLGSDTGRLGLRVGLHSGPVTAGVLRGEKARFQLFGDTVNTAARMESNGEKGRIQVSEQTADLLMEAGKGSWIRPREDKIEAKGKGLLQTYWLEPKLITLFPSSTSTTATATPRSKMVDHISTSDVTLTRTKPIENTKQDNDTTHSRRSSI